MMTTFKQKIDSVSTTLQLGGINTSLRSITRYAWLTAGMLFACYLYFVGAITFSVIKQESLAQGIKTTISETSKEELKFLNFQKNLTESYAGLEGFVSAPVISYTAPVHSFAWNSNVRE